jgi:hypothetical protein
MVNIQGAIRVPVTKHLNYCHNAPTPAVTGQLTLLAITKDRFLTMSVESPPKTATRATRGIRGETDHSTKCKDLNTPQNLQNTRKTCDQIS